jgi:hypothetical protein
MIAPLPRSAAGGRFTLSATVDFHSDIAYQGVHTLAQLDAMMSFLRDIGVRRLYWLYYGDIEPTSELYSPIFDSEPHGPETIALLGEPLRAAVPLAHRYGLEICGVLKPFHGGSTITSAEGAHGAAFGPIPRIGGRLWDTDAYLVREPSLRIARRPEPRAQGDATETSARIAEIRLVKADDTATRIQREHLEIWSSPDNRRYRRRDIPFTLQEEVRPATSHVYDYYGRLLTRAGDPVRILRLALPDHLDDPFVLLTTTFREGPSDFRNSAIAMVEAVGLDRRTLPIVVATRSATARSTRDFRTSGLEFDCGYGPFPIDLDIDNAASQETWSVPQGGCVAFAVGKNAFLAGAPCESEHEVRRIWLRRLRRMIEAGVDGVDVRVSAHGSLTDEPTAYGFNPVVLDAYRERFGSDPDESAGDMERLASVRGAAYTQFLRAARAMLIAAHVPMQVHLHTEAFRPAPPHGALMGFPANLRFDWPGWLDAKLADAATLRTSWYEAMGPRENVDLPALLRDPVVKDTMDLAGRHHIPLYLNRYAMAGGVIVTGERQDRYLDDLEVAYHEPRLAGFDVYEVFTLMRPTSDGLSVEPIGDFAERLKRQVRRLGIA